MKIDKDTLDFFAWYQHDAVSGDWRQAAFEFQNETRWGVVNQIVLEHVPTKTFWEFMNETSSGDGEYSTLNDECGEEIELKEVHAHTKTITEYR